jgi:hypothetical protein
MFMINIFNQNKYLFILERMSKKVLNKFFNTETLKVEGKNMLNLISDLYDNLDKVPVLPKVEPGFLRVQFEE